MKNWIKKNPIKSVLLAIIIPIQTLNFTGFCYDDFTYYSEEELLQIAAGHYLKEEPYCCSINNKPVYVEGLEWALNTMLGNHLYGIILHYKKEYISQKRQDRPYYYAVSSVNQCGKGLGKDEYGDPLTEKQYLNIIQNNKKRKQENDK